MALISPEELQDVMLQEALQPLSDEDQERIAAMVSAGFQTWEEFHEKFAREQQAIRAQDPGILSWKDVGNFLSRHSSVKPVSDFNTSSFVVENDQVTTLDSSVEVVKLDDGKFYYLGGSQSMPVQNEKGQTATPLGINLESVAHALRQAAFPVEESGAALLRWPDGYTGPGSESNKVGVLIFARQRFESRGEVSWREVAVEMRIYLISPKIGVVSIDDDVEKGELCRALFTGQIRGKPTEEIEIKQPICPMATLAEG